MVDRKAADQKHDNPIAGKPYEIMFVIRPDAEQLDIDQFLALLQNRLTDGGAMIRSIKSMGLRRLAYTVKGLGQGHYFLVTVVADGKLIDDVERHLRVSPQVLKFITVRVDEEEKRLARIETCRSFKAQTDSAKESVEAESASKRVLDQPHRTFLSRLSNIIMRRLGRENFCLLSQFSERFGVWEQRLTRNQGGAVGLISVACDLEETNLIPIQVWAGISILEENAVLSQPPARVLVGELNLPLVGGASFTSDLEASLNSAVQKVEELSSTMLGFGRIPDAMTSPSTPGVASLSRV